MKKITIDINLAIWILVSIIMLKPESLSFFGWDVLDTTLDVLKIVVAFIAAGSPPPVIARHGLPEGFNEQMGGFLAKGDFGGAIGAVTPEALDAFSVCGTPDEFIPKIEALAEMGVTQYVAGSPVGKNVEESIKLLGDVIASF